MLHKKCWATWSSIANGECIICRDKIYSDPVLVHHHPIPALYNNGIQLIIIIIILLLLVKILYRDESRMDEM